MTVPNFTLFTNVVLILSVALLVVATVYCIVAHTIDRKRYKAFLSLQKEEVKHKEISDAHTSDANETFLAQSAKLVSKYRVLSPYQLFLIMFFLSAILLFLPCCIYSAWRATGFVEWSNIFFKSIFNTMKVFVLGNAFSDILSEEFISGLSYKTAQAYSFSIHMLFVGGGLLVARAAFSLFKEFAAYLKYWVIHPCSEIYVMSKLNEKSVALAEDIFKKEYSEKIFADAEHLQDKCVIKKFLVHFQNLIVNIIWFAIIIILFLLAVLTALMITIAWLVCCGIVGIFCILSLGALIKPYWFKETIWKGGHKFMLVYAKAVCDFCVKRSKIFNRLFHKRRIYFCDVYPQNNDYQAELIDRAKNIGAIVMKRDITGLRMKWWCRSRSVYIIGEDDGENIKQVMALFRVCTRSKTQNEILNRPETQIYVFASDCESEYVLDWLNAELWKAYENDIKYKDKTDKRWDRKKTESPFMKIRRINEYVNFAVSFFWKRWKNFFAGAKKLDSVQELNVAIVGCGRYGYEFLKVLCCVGQFPNHRLKVQVFDRNIELCKQRFSVEFLDNITKSVPNDRSKHRLPYYDVTFEKSVDVNSKVFSDAIKEDTTHVFVMLGDDELNINTSMRIRTELTRRNQNSMIYAIVNDYQKSYNLKQTDKLYTYDIHPIGRTITRYSEKAIKQQNIENWGVSVHKRFIFNKVLGECYDKMEKDFNNAMKKISGLSKDLIEQLHKNFRQAILIDTYQILLHHLNRVWEAELRNDMLATINGRDWNDKNLSGYEPLLDRQLEQMYDYEKENYTQEENDKVKAALEKFATSEKNFIKDLIASIKEKLWKMHYDRCEYYRRASRSRALFEYLLYKKNILASGDNGKVVIAENVVKEFFGEEEWTKQGALKFPRSEWGRKELDIKTDVEPKDWENGQWYELNNIMQKRWMLFMWGEGYRYDAEKAFEESQRVDHIKRTHRYLVPYAELFRHEQDRVSQTLEFVNMEQIVQNEEEI